MAKDVKSVLIEEESIVKKKDRKDCIYFEDALEEESSKRDKLCG